MKAQSRQMFEDRLWSLLRQTSYAGNGTAEREWRQSVDSLTSRFPKQERRFWSVFGDICDQLTQTTLMVLEEDLVDALTVFASLPGQACYWPKSVPSDSTYADFGLDLGNGLQLIPDSSVEHWEHWTHHLWEDFDGWLFLPNSVEGSRGVESVVVDNSRLQSRWRGKDRENFKEWARMMTAVIEHYPWVAVPSGCRESGQLLIFWNDNASAELLHAVSRLTEQDVSISLYARENKAMSWRDIGNPQLTRKRADQIKL